MTISSVAPYGVSHFEVTVRDLARSLGFYRDLLGLRVIQEGTSDRAFPNAARLRIYEEPVREFRFAVLDCGAGPTPVGGAPTIVLLCPLGAPATGGPIKVDQIGLTHFGLWVRRLDAVCEQLKAHGVTFLEAPHTMIETPEGTWRSAFTQDPDGIIVQLDEFVPRTASQS